MHEVTDRVRILVDHVLPRDERIGNDVRGRRGGHQDMRLVASCHDGARQIRLPRDRRIDLLRLESGRCRRRVLRKDDVLLDRCTVLRAQTRLRQQVQQQEVRRRELRAGDLVAFQLFDRIDRAQGDDAVPAARPVLHDDRLGALTLLGEDRGLARPVVDRVPHDVDVAVAKRREFGRRVFQQHELHVQPVLRAVAGSGIGIEAVVEDDARRMPGPGIDPDHERPIEFAGGRQRRSGNAGRAGAARRVGRCALQRIEIGRRDHRCRGLRVRLLRAGPLANLVTFVVPRRVAEHTEDH